MDLMKIVLRAAYDRFSGYGNDAVDLAIALEKAGADVTPLPTAILPGLPREFTALLEKDPTGEKDVLLQFAPPQELSAGPPREFRNMPAVAYTMWERTPMTVHDFPQWLTSVRSHPDGARPLDGWKRLVVTCPMNLEAFEPVTPDDTQMAVVPCGIAPDDWPIVRRDPGKGPVRFLMVGMLGGRKDPWVFLETWARLKREHPDWDATLTVHTIAGGGIHPRTPEATWEDDDRLLKYRDMTVSTTPLSRQDLVALYASHDVMVSTSRGEGNNKPAMEFMATGGLVMATDWSGHQNWLHPSATIALPGRLEEARGASWAQEFAVDVPALEAAVLDVSRDRQRISDMGMQAAGVVRASLSWDSVAERMLQTVARML